MTNLLDTLQATLANAKDFLDDPSQQTYDRMLATAAIHVREDLEEQILDLALEGGVTERHPNATFHGVCLSLIDKLPVLPTGPMEFGLGTNVANMLAVLKYSRNPAAATFSLWNPGRDADLATDLFYLATYALAEDIRQVLILS